MSPRTRPRSLTTIAELITTREAADLLGITPKSVSDLATDGRLDRPIRGHYRRADVLRHKAERDRRAAEHPPIPIDVPDDATPAERRKAKKRGWWQQNRGAAAKKN